MPIQSLNYFTNLHSTERNFINNCMNKCIHSECQLLSRNKQNIINIIEYALVK